MPKRIQGVVYTFGAHITTLRRSQSAHETKGCVARHVAGLPSFYTWKRLLTHSGSRACDRHIRPRDIANVLDVGADFDVLPQVLLNRPGLCRTHLPRMAITILHRRQLEQWHLFLSRCGLQSLIEEGAQVAKILLHGLPETLLVQGCRRV